MKIFKFVILFLLLPFFACNKGDEPQANIAADDLLVTIDENPDNGQVLGTITGSSDVGAITYSISSESIEGAFSINASTGELSVANKLAFDYETSPALTAIISLSNGSKTATSNVTVNLNDLEFVWNGTKTTFYKPANADTNAEAFQDRITENVWLTRASNGVLINKAPGAIGCDPGNVMMAYGKAADRASLTFSDCMKKLEETELKYLPGKDVVFYLVADDIYLDVHFLSWSSGSSGGEFSYERSTPN